MATGKVKTLYENAAQTQAIFPRTVIEAISDNEGNSLQSILSSKLSTSRTINGQPLTSNINLGASQVGAISYNSPQTFAMDQQGIIKSNLNLQNPDWEENDSSSPAYIKNRTHWKEITTTSQNKINTITAIGEIVAQNIWYAGTWNKSFSLTPGATYKIIGVNNDYTRESTFVYSDNQFSLFLPYTHTDLHITAYCDCVFTPEGVSISCSGMWGTESLENLTMPEETINATRFELYELVEECYTYHPLAAEYLPIPDMLPDSEYEVLEKHMGKQVYTKLINFGAVPSSTTRNIAYHDDANVIPIRMHSYVIKDDESSIYTLPYVDPTSGVSDILQGKFRAIYPHASNNLVSIRSTMDEPDASIYAIVWYVYK